MMDRGMALEGEMRLVGPKRGLVRFTAIARALAVLAIIFSAATPGLAGIAAGTGPLNDVDADAGTVEIRSETFDVEASSVLLDSNGKRMSMLELEQVQAPWVVFRTRPGYPRRILDTLQLIDEDADEVD